MNEAANPCSVMYSATLAALAVLVDATLAAYLLRPLSKEETAVKKLLATLILFSMPAMVFGQPPPQWPQRPVSFIDGGDKPKSPLPPNPSWTYDIYYKLACVEDKPLIVYVGQDAKSVPGCLTMHLATFANTTPPAIVIGVPLTSPGGAKVLEGVWLPPTASSDQIKQAIAKVLFTVGGRASVKLRGACGCENCPLGGTCQPGASCGSPSCPYSLRPVVDANGNGGVQCVGGVCTVPQAATQQQFYLPQPTYFQPAYQPQFQGFGQPVFGSGGFMRGGFGGGRMGGGGGCAGGSCR